MCSLPGPGSQPKSPALASRFLTTGPPGKSLLGGSLQVLLSGFSPAVHQHTHTYVCMCTHIDFKWLNILSSEWKYFIRCKAFHFPTDLQCLLKLFQNLPTRQTGDQTTLSQNARIFTRSQLMSSFPACVMWLSSRNQIVSISSFRGSTHLLC